MSAFAFNWFVLAPMALLVGVGGLILTIHEIGVARARRQP